MVGRSIIAASNLEKEGFQARVIEIHTIKPLDKDILLEAATETGVLVTVEEHALIGGLGSAVAELLADVRPTPLERIGIRDSFCPTGRSVDGLLDACGLSVSAVVQAAKRALARK
jgi:transketolase